MVHKFLMRTVVSIVLAILVYFVIYVFPEWIFCGVVSLFIGLGLADFFKMVENREIFVYKYFGTVVGVLLPIVIMLGYYYPQTRNLEPLLAALASFFVLTLQFMRRDNARDHLISTALTIFALFYVSWFFSFFVKIRMLENGSNLVAFVIIVTKSADIGAYLVGSLVGKNELIPRISPKKTREGTIGGIIISVILSVWLGRMLTGFSVGNLIFVGALLAILGQVGDLAESLIKRDCNVKDSGAYLGGIGGVLDLIDSLIFTVPIFYFYVKIFLR